MTRATGAGGSLWVERADGLGGAGVWAVSAAGRESVPSAGTQQWLAAAEQMFLHRPETGSVSVVASPLPLHFVSGYVAELIGLDVAAGMEIDGVRLQGWLDTATAKGLSHLRLPAPDEHQAPSLPRPEVPAPLARAISLGIDAEWLLGGESGAQVFVFEMLKELARRTEIARIVMLSDTGGVPRALEGVAKVSGMSWTAALAGGAPVVDILHRPYLPGANVDYRRYQKAGKCVALTVLDFIAYDIPGYHESAWAWRRYRQGFDENVSLADGLFAISHYVGSRLQRQFGDRVAPVRSVLLGTDHLNGVTNTAAIDGGPAVSALDDTRFLLVLGNDFEHKNRDFAVKVFADMRDRGYEGRLVLAGFHIDLGSSYGHELSGADRHVDRIVRMGPVSAAEKTWLLRHADAVLYPTSCEGFGLVPFEASAVGTPTAFVRFGPLAETMPGVEACAGWQVRLFADHVFRLMADPEAQVRQILAAGASLTWAAHVDRVLCGYQHLLSDETAWRARRRALPGPGVRAARAIDSLIDRVTNKLRRLAGRASGRAH